MNTITDRTKIVVGGPGSNSDILETMSSYQSEVAVLAICDTCLLERESRGVFVGIRHTYYVYHVRSVLDEPDYEALFAEAVQVYLNSRGIVIRVMDHDINIIRVQITFGDNLIRSTMADLICQKMLELKASK